MHILRNFSLSWDKKILALQTACHAVGLYTLVVHFNFWYALSALCFSNLVVNLGIGLCFHRMYAHRSWKAKPLVENTLHFLGVLNCMGPAINWVGTHRLHHATADTVDDPHSPVGKPLYKVVLYWFNFWEKHTVDLKYVKDLIRSPNQRFFFKNYFTVVFLWALLLYFVGGSQLVLYGFFVTTMFSLHSVSWITVGAHIFGTRDHDTKDKSLNTKIMGLYLWGEGYHNNHHWRPSSPDFGLGRFDLGYTIIKLIGVLK